MQIPPNESTSNLFKQCQYEKRHYSLTGGRLYDALPTDFQPNTNGL